MNNGRRPVNGDNELFQHDPHWRDLMLFYEYFHGDTGARPSAPAIRPAGPAWWRNCCSKAGSKAAGAKVDLPRLTLPSEIVRQVQPWTA